MAKLTQKNILTYTQKRISQEAIKRHYKKWRLKQVPPLPDRCDNPECMFHSQPLYWNGKPLKLILDHKNGVNSYNRPENLQFLCPNCNSQQPTHGGGNKGRVQKDKGGFSVRRTDGKKDYTLPADPGEFK